MLAYACRCCSVEDFPLDMVVVDDLDVHPSGIGTVIEFSPVSLEAKKENGLPPALEPYEEDVEEDPRRMRKPSLRELEAGWTSYRPRLSIHAQAALMSQDLGQLESVTRQRIPEPAAVQTERHGGRQEPISDAPTPATSAMSAFSRRLRDAAGAAAAALVGGGAGHPAERTLARQASGGTVSSDVEEITETSVSNVRSGGAEPAPKVHLAAAAAPGMHGDGPGGGSSDGCGKAAQPPQPRQPRQQPRPASAAVASATGVCKQPSGSTASASSATTPREATDSSSAPASARGAKGCATGAGAGASGGQRKPRRSRPDMGMAPAEGEPLATSRTVATDRSFDDTRPLKFRINLVRGMEAVGAGEDWRLGADTEALVDSSNSLLQRGRGALRIVSVSPDGLIGGWNRAHRRRQVLPGDFVTEVNGRRGGPEELYAAIAAAAELELQILRVPRHQD